MNKTEAIAKAGEFFLDQDAVLTGSYDPGKSWRQIKWLHPEETRIEASILLRKIGFDIGNESKIIKQLNAHLKDSEPAQMQMQDLGVMFRYLREQTGTRFDPQQLEGEHRAIWDILKTEAEKLGSELNLPRQSIEHQR